MLSWDIFITNDMSSILYNAQECTSNASWYILSTCKSIFDTLSNICQCKKGVSLSDIHYWIDV